MMIPSPAAGDPYARAAALDRALRSPDADVGDAASNDGGTAPASSPDVIVTLSQGASAPGTYDASGRLPGRPTLDDMGANAADSVAQAGETGDDTTAASAEATTDPAGAAAAPAAADANAEQQAVPA